MLRGCLIALARDVGGVDRRDVNVVAEGVPHVQPGFEGDPSGGEVGDVLAADDVVVVNLGGPDQIPRRRPGPGPLPGTGRAARLLAGG